MTRVSSKGLLTMLVVALAATACAKYQYMGGSKRPPTTPPTNSLAITLDDPQEQCIKTSPADALYGYGGATGNTVTWGITNNCSVDVTFEVYDFKEKFRQIGKKYPFTEPRLTVPVPAGQTRTLTATVRPTSEVPGEKGFHVFKYRMRINGREIDPEIIIEWP